MKVEITCEEEKREEENCSLYKSETNLYEMWCRLM